MNLQQAKIILEKINRLYQSMALDEKNIDVFEQDLMLSYVKQLYETFSADTNGQQEPIRQAIPRRETPVLAEKNRQAEVIVEEPKVIREEPRAIREEPKVVKEEPSPAPIVREAPKVVIPEPVAPKVETPPPPPVYVAPPTPAKKDTPEYDELFEQQQAKELSEKLSSQPLRDLNKALGINEKQERLCDRGDPLALSFERVGDDMHLRQRRRTVRCGLGRRHGPNLFRNPGKRSVACWA